jgi:hypothetical protein
MNMEISLTNASYSSFHQNGILWLRLSKKEHKYQTLNYTAVKCTYSTCRAEIVPTEVGMFPFMLLPLKFLLTKIGSYFCQIKQKC